MKYAPRIPESDMASEFKRTRPDASDASVHFPATLAAVPALTEEKRWDALRVVEKCRQDSGDDYAAMREVVAALGLADLRQDPLLAEPCPLCGAAAGARCFDGAKVAAVVHQARRPVAEPEPEPEWKRQARAVECPLCEAEPGDRCVSKTGNLIPNVHSVRARAAKSAEENGGTR